MKSPLMKLVGMLSWLLTALCAVHEGLLALGYDLYAYLGLASHPQAVKVISYTFGVAGLISLLMFFGALSCRGCGSCKDDARCSQNGNNNNGFKK